MACICNSILISSFVSCAKSTELFKALKFYLFDMVVFPNAKINIGLYVTEQRPDGYHNLETVFYPAPLQDVLEIVPADTEELFLSGLPVPGDKANNLIWKAYQLLRAAYPSQVPLLHIYLHKVIPMGAGLGGGSADAAFVLQAINKLFQLGIDKSTLHRYALSLGSDCPFFIENTPQFAGGRGEILAPMALDLSAYEFKFIHPGIHVSTALAFSKIKIAPARFDLRTLPQLPMEQWKDTIENVFEQVVFAMHPEIASAKEALYAQGAVYAAMSGSGSSVFGIFKK